MGKVRSEITYFVFALIVLVISVPLLPSSLILKPESISLDSEHISFTRKMMLPLDAHWSVEFEKISPPPPIRRVDCDQSGEAHFEKRYGLPVIFKHNCDFGDDVAAEYLLRMCWQVNVAALHMRPVCMTKTFFPHASELGEQLDAIQRELKILKEASQ